MKNLSQNNLNESNESNENNTQNTLVKNQSNQNNSLAKHDEIPPKQLTYIKKEKDSFSGFIIVSLIIAVIGVFTNISWLGLAGAIAGFIFAIIQIIPYTQEWIRFFLTPQERQTLIGMVGLFFTTIILGSIRKNLSNGTYTKC